MKKTVTEGSPSSSAGTLPTKSTMNKTAKRSNQPSIVAANLTLPQKSPAATIGTKTLKSKINSSKTSKTTKLMPSFGKVPCLPPQTASQKRVS